MSRRNEKERGLRGREEVRLRSDFLCHRPRGDAMTTRTTRRSISPSFRRRVWSTSESSILSTVREKAIRLNNASVVPLSRASFHEHLTKLLWNAKKYAPRLDVTLPLRGNSLSAFFIQSFLTFSYLFLSSSLFFLTVVRLRSPILDRSDEL